MIIQTYIYSFLMGYNIFAKPSFRWSTKVNVWNGKNLSEEDNHFKDCHSFTGRGICDHWKWIQKTK